MKVKLARAAETDLLKILLYGIEHHGLDQAERYKIRLERSFEVIADAPEIARLRREITPPVRVHPVGSHLIIYLVDADVIRILRVRHHRENWVESPL